MAPAHQVVLAHDAGVLARHQQEMAEATIGKCSCFRDDLVDRQRAAGDVVAGRESAIGAHRHTLVGDVERREQVDGATEPAHGRCMSQPGHVLQPPGRGGRQQGGEVGETAAAAGSQRPLDVVRPGTIDERSQGGEVDLHQVGGRGAGRD